MSSENGVHHRNRRPAASRSGDREKIRRNSAGASSERRGQARQGTGTKYKQTSGQSRSAKTSQSTRQTQSSYSSSNYKKGPSKKNDNGNIPMIVGGIVAVIAVIAIVAFLIKGGSLSGNDPSEMMETQAEGSFKNDVYVDVSAITDEVPVDTADESSQADEDTEDSDAESSEAVSGAVVNLKGLTPGQAKEKIAGLYEWSMVISNADADEGATVKPTVNAEEITTEAATMPDAENPDSLPEGETAETSPSEIVVSKTIEVPDFVAQKTEELLSEITAEEELYSAAMASEDTSEEGTADDESDSETAAEAPKVYKLSLDGLEDRIDKVAADAEMMWNKTAQGGSIGSYDAETDTFKMEGAKDGYDVDTEKLISDISSAISNRDFTANIAVSGTVISGNDDTNLPDYEIIGTYTTETTSNSVRNKNIRLACEALNGTIIRPGEEFSFNDVVGERTEAKGYGAAAAYNNGEVVQEIGGGVCQVSTTLYNAVLRSGLKTTKRQSHTFKPTYVTPGFDATISWGGPDYKFINAPAIDEYSNSDSYSIGIKASYSNQKVTVSIYGRPVLKDGITYELKSAKIKDMPVVRKPIPEGSDKTPTTGTMGSQWATNLVIKKDGEVISDKLDHNTYYSGHIEYYDENAESSSETLPSSSVDPSSETAETAETPAALDEPSYVQGPDGGPGVTVAPSEPGSQTPSTGAPTISPTAAPTTAVPEPTTSAVQPGGPSGGPQPGGGGVVSDAPVSPI